MKMPNDSGAQILLKAGYNVHSKHYDKTGALHWAARQGHADAIKYLLATGVDVDSKDSKNQTALVLVLEQGHTAALEALLDAHPVIVKTEYGDTPAATGGWERACGRGACPLDQAGQNELDRERQVRGDQRSVLERS